MSLLALCSQRDTLLGHQNCIGKNCSKCPTKCKGNDYLNWSIHKEPGKWFFERFVFCHAHWLFLGVISFITAQPYPKFTECPPPTPQEPENGPDLINSVKKLFCNLFSFPFLVTNHSGQESQVVREKYDIRKSCTA